MNIDDIKAQVKSLPKEQQDHLAAYLVHLRHERDPQLRKELAARIDDRDPKNWRTLDELKEHWKE